MTEADADQRDLKILKLYDMGVTQSHIAKRVGLNPKSVSKKICAIQIELENSEGRSGT